jgi:hypothetical protein
LSAAIPFAAFSANTGGSMSAQGEVVELSRVQLNDEDVAYLMNFLRNATQPVTTQQLIDVLRRQSDQFRSAAPLVADTEPA